MNNYPKVHAIVRMPDGTKVEIVEFLRYNTATSFESRFRLRNKMTLDAIGDSQDSLTRAFGELYGRIKAQENKIRANKACPHCGR